MPLSEKKKISIVTKTLANYLQWGEGGGMTDTHQGEEKIWLSLMVGIQISYPKDTWTLYN